jgi:amino acid adenylation domain-containing protein
VFIERNATGRTFAKDMCIHQLFEWRAEETPEATAVICGELRITYRELNERSNQLAHYLRELGVKTNEPIAICLERSIEMLIGVLGVLKAGGAYVPLDPSYPQERLAFMVYDTRSRFLLTQNSLVKIVSAIGTRLVCLDNDNTEIRRQSNDTPTSQATPDGLAYVIYTSGSTGKPKGVAITHYNVVRLFQATDQWFRFGRQDRWVLFHSFAFDFSVWEMWGALLYGGQLIVVPYMVSRSPEAFYDLLERERVTILNQTPSAFMQLMEFETDALNPKELTLRLVIFGGEALDLSSLAPWFDRHGDARPQLVNMYGITETTVHVTYRPLTRSDVDKGSLIGRPLPDLQVHILDEHLQPVPIGTSGEIWVGGAGLAQGYLNLPELTASKFIADPFSGIANERLYRSGDLARYVSNGDIEYLGRIDQQVKIRGFRIELGEIETTLRQHPGVRQCAVVAREDSTGDRQLAAYVVPFIQHGAPTTDQLRQLLKDKLPEHMIPATFVVQENLPLTFNGKIDRKALSMRRASGTTSEGCYVAPRNPMEEAVAEIWRKVLGMNRIDIQANFFALGGHSLQATRLITKVHKLLNYKLSISEFFQNPTIEGMARILQKEKEDDKENQLMPSFSHVVPIRPQGSTSPPLFLIHGIGGRILGFYGLIRHLEPDQRIYGVEYRIADITTPVLSLEHLARRYIEDILKVQPEGPYYFLGYSFGGILTFEIAQQLCEMGKQVGLLGMVDTLPMNRAERKGAPKSLIRTTKMKLQALAFHARRFLRDPDRLAYIRDEWLMKKGNMIARIRGVIYAAVTTGGRPLPKFLENPYAVNWFAASRYQPRPYHGHITLFRATSGEVAAYERSGDEVDWKPLALGGVAVHEIDGTHHDILHEPNVHLLAEKVTACLALPHVLRSSQLSFAQNNAAVAQSETITRGWTTSESC